MQIKYTETDYGFFIEMNPENVKDASSLMRMSAQGNIGTVEVRTSFSSDINTFIDFRKKKCNAVPRAIRNGKMKSY